MTVTKGVSSASTSCLSASCSKLGRGLGRAWRAIKQFDQNAVGKLGHGGMGLIWLTLSVALFAIIAYGLIQVAPNPHCSFSSFDEIVFVLSVPLFPLTFGTAMATGRLAIGNLRVALCHPRAQSPEVDNPEFSKHSKDEEANL